MKKIIATMIISTLSFAVFAKRPAIVTAAFEADFEKIDQLLIEGADINDASDLYTPLQAIFFIDKKKGSPNFVVIFNNAEELLKRGAFIDGRNKHGETALIFAAKSGSFELVKFIVEQGGDINLEGNNGLSALQMVNKKNFDQQENCITSYLIRQGANPYFRTENGALRHVLQSYAEMNNLKKIADLFALSKKIQRDKESQELRAARILIKDFITPQSDAIDEKRAIDMLELSSFLQNIERLLANPIDIVLTTAQGQSDILNADHELYDETMTMFYEHLECYDGWDDEDEREYYYKEIQAALAADHKKAESFKANLKENSYLLTED